MERREFLKSCTAVAAIVATPIPVVAKPVPYWTVGPFRGDSLDIVYPVRAHSAEEAIRIVGLEQYHTNEEVKFCGLCKRCDGQCGLDPEGVADGLVANREKIWDNIEGEPRSVDWVKAGYCTNCQRCGYESVECQVVGDEAACENCITREEWAVIDPEYYEDFGSDQ